MDYKTILGYIAILIGLVGFVIYFNQIFRGRVRPHAFSWFLWGLTTAIIFAAQVVKQGGAGSWATGYTSFACFAIFVAALHKGSRKFAKLDWIFLISTLISLGLWVATHDPTLSVILITISDALACLPTIRKAFSAPDEESAILFALSGLKFAMALFALESYPLVTWLYPASVVITNWLVVLILLLRRKQLKSPT